MGTVDASGLRTALKGGGKAPLIIDVLFEEQSALRRIKGAAGACVYNVTFLDEVAALVPDRSTPVVVYGADGHDHSAHAARDKMLRAGYADVRLLEGGIAAWAESGFPMEGSDLAADLDPWDRIDPVVCPYKAVPGESTIQWWGRNHSGAHHGYLNLASGSVDLDQDLGLKGELILDMRSITNLDLEGDDMRPVLEGHLRSDDFFFTDKFPQARLSFGGVHADVPAGSPNYDLLGKLALRGVKAPLAVPATLGHLAEGRLALSARFEWDRTAWGVVYGSGRFFKFLGYHVVYDLVGVQARVVLEPS